MMTARKTVTAFLIAFVVSLFAAMPIMAQDVFEAVPADALFAVRINNFEYTLGQLDQFMTGLAPTPNTASMMGRMQLANILGDPNMSNVNLRGQMAFFGTASQKEPNALPKLFVSGLIPVADYKNFISSNPSATKPDANGISTIGQMKLLVAQDANYAILAAPNEYAALVNAVKTAKTKNLASTISTDQREASAKTRIWAYGDVQKAMKLYGPTVFEKMVGAKNAIAARDPNMAKLSQFMAVYMDFLKSLMNETKDITIAVNPKTDALGLSSTFTAIPGTEMAGMLATNSAANGQNKLLGYLPDNAVMNFAAKIDKPSMIKMYEKFFDAFTPILGPKFTAEEKAKALSLVRTSINSLGNELAYCLIAEPNAKQTFGLMYAFEVADTDAFKKSMDAGAEMMNAPYMADFFQTIGLMAGCEIKRNTEKYNGVSLDVVKVELASIDPNARMGQMIVKMYGENLTGKIAVVNGVAFYALGANADAHIKNLIDTAKAGGPKEINAEIKNAMAVMPDSNQAEFIGTYNYLRVIQMSAGIMPIMPFDANTLQQLTSKSNIAFAGNENDGAFTFTLTLPKQHALEIKSAFETLKLNLRQPCNQ
jgi:hypothetical protein